MKTSHGQNCKNHPLQRVLGSCRVCHEWLCFQCLQEGPQYYYCYKPKCQKVFRVEMKIKPVLKPALCPTCKKEIKNSPRFCPNCSYRLKSVTVEEPDDLITLFRYGTPLEAHLARTKLESKNIESYVIDEHMISLFPTRDIGWGGVKLKIKKSEVRKALRVLNDPMEGSFWVPHPLATAVYMYPEIVGVPLLILLTPFAFLLKFVLKSVVWKFIHDFVMFGRGSG